jgi:hypothetical protein
MQPNVSLIMNTENIQSIMPSNILSVYAPLYIQQIHYHQSSPRHTQSVLKASRQNAYLLAVLFKTKKQMKLRFERHKIEA